MSYQQENPFTLRYFVVKSHQWRGNLKRILVINQQNVSTYDVSEYKLTNSYSTHDIKEFFPNTIEEDSNTITTGAEQQFTICFPNTKMKFRSKHRSDILTDLFKVCTNHSYKYAELNKKYTSIKHRWSGENVKVVLEVGVYSVNKLHASTGQLLSTYYYKDIYKLITVKDYELGPAFVISSENECFHFFIVNDEATCKEIMERIKNVARKNVGVVIPISFDSITYDQYTHNRLGVQVAHIVPLHTFRVQKISAGAEKKRIIEFTDQYLLERDANTNEIINLRSLTEIYALVRPKTDSQMFSIQFLNGESRFYSSTERDNLLSSAFDSVRASGNVNVHVKLSLNHHKIISHPEIETVRYIHLKKENRDSLRQAVEFFTENSFYVQSLISPEWRKERKEIDRAVHLAIGELLQDNYNDICDDEFCNHLLALRYLFLTKPGFGFFIVDRRWKDREIELLFIKLKKALARENDVITFNAIDMLCALMKPLYDENDLFYEQKNKGFLLSSERFFPILLDLMKYHITKGTGALVISAILDFLTYALCAPYSETTDGGHFDMILELVAKSGRCLFKLFNHQSFSIVKATCLIMKAVIEEGNVQVAKTMQELALREGTFLFHLQSSLFPYASGQGFFPIQILSRKLMSLWTVDNETALQLLNNIFPLGLLNFLESDEQPPKEAINSLDWRDNLKIAQDFSNKPISNLQKLRDNYPSVRIVERHIENTFNHWRKRIGFNNTEVTEENKPIVLRRRREFIKSALNWNLFFYQFAQNHATPDLIWNHKTRDELREALEREFYYFNSEKELHGGQQISWNFYEFEVVYPSLNDEIKIGNYYLRLLLSQDNSSVTTEANLTNRIYIKSPSVFFNTLYHRFLSHTRLSMKADCLHAMSIIYGEYHEEIGPFEDINFVVSILKECVSRTLRDRIVQFLDKLMKNSDNIKSFIGSQGILILIDLATLSHLHVNRAVIPTQTNVIEASPDMVKDSAEKEWHISENSDPLSLSDLKELWTQEKINSATKCWAQGYNVWKKISEISQLKWTLMAEDNAIFQENDMTILILNILIKLCEAYPSRAPDKSIIRPMSKVKQILSEESCLSHLIHLLLTFDPVIVEKVARLVYLIMEDNPRISLLYQTGLFYFILMYTGSNILPISRLLHLTHMKQSFKSDDNQQGSVLYRSILGQMLPEAMVCYLENYGSEPFSKVFLGEFDTPEVIWNYEMRRFMIERIAAHIVDFSPRLQTNVRAIYQYCPIPPISYTQLENELFCNIFYLKNLCDTKRFNDWKINDPVSLLRDILEIWKKEIKKKPNTMQVEDALDILEIKNYDGKLSGSQFESLIRKRYYALAQKYHPDKNPTGREMFEKVNEAYYFLCSNNNKSSGPDPQNIILILKTQSILFSRHGERLHEYKYAGYPMLLKTLQMEMNDQYLFSKTNPLLAHACKTVFHSVQCSALNAEELRREEGLDILYDILNRCVSMLSASSKRNELPVKVCRYIISCFGVSSKFVACRRYFYQMTFLSKNVFYILNYKHLSKLCIAAIDCATYFCADPYLQLLLFKSGILFSLLQFIFKYDYTLEENDIEAGENTSKQYLSNELAKKSLMLCVALFEDNFNSAQIEDKSLLDDYSSIRQTLFALLTPYIANQLAPANVPELLKMLNSNIENPYFIWNNNSRAELLTYIQQQEKELLRSGVCMDESFGAQFVYSSHKEELIISDIFVRIYNTQPNFSLTNVKQFVISLLDHIGSHAQFLHAVKAVSFPKQEGVVIDESRVDTIKQCLLALINLIKHNSMIESLFVGHFKYIFSFLHLDNQQEIKSLVLQLIMILSTNKDCIVDISNSGVIVYLMLLFYTQTNITESASKLYLDIMDIMISFSSNSELVKEGISKGVLLYALHLFIGKNHNSVREKSAQLLTKMNSDQLNKQYISWVLSQFLPTLFLNAMKDAPQNAINLYDENKENPELIWSEDSRKGLFKHLNILIAELHKNQLNNPNHTWKFSNDCEFKLSFDSGEYQIAGVYLRLYIQSPGWILSRPKDFLHGLLATMKTLIEKPDSDDTKLDLISTALFNLFSTQPELLGLIPPTGYLQVLVNRLKTPNQVVAKACLVVIQKFSTDTACLYDMIATNCLAVNLDYVLKTHSELNECLCDVLVKIFEANNYDFISQAIKCELIIHLLKILDSNASQSTKAKIVQMLQCIRSNPYCGAQVSEILDSSNIWKEYKDQKHDLFITNSHNTQYLTGPSVNIAGYLTQTSTNTLPLVPPPIEE